MKPKNPIRILQMIGSLEMGGSQAFIMNLYRNIDREKIQFDFIINYSNQIFFKPEIESLGGCVYTMPTFKGGNMSEVKRTWNSFFYEHPEYKVLHSHIRSYASIYLPIAKKHGVKTIIHSHSTSNGSGAIALVKSVLQHPLRRQADYFMACSREAGEWLFGKKVCAGDRYLFIKNAIDVEKYRVKESVRNEYRKKLGIDDKLVFIHVGRLHEAKNHMFLLEIFKEIHDEKKNAILLIVGDGSLRTAIEEKIQQLSFSGSILMLGSRSDVAELLQASDVFLFPSKWEGLPVTVVEAQAASLPCIISDRISIDVDVSELVHRLPIDSAKDWAKLALSDMPRIDVSDKIRKAGFDVKGSAKMITDIYLGIIGEE